MDVPWCATNGTPARATSTAATDRGMVRILEEVLHRELPDTRRTQGGGDPAERRRVVQRGARIAAVEFVGQVDRLCAQLDPLVATDAEGTGERLVPLPETGTAQVIVGHVAEGAGRRLGERGDVE